MRIVVDVKIGRVELAKCGQLFEIEYLDERRPKDAKLFFAQLPHDAVHMDGGKTADFGKIGLSQSKRKPSPVA